MVKEQAGNKLTSCNFSNLEQGDLMCLKGKGIPVVQNPEHP